MAAMFVFNILKKVLLPIKHERSWGWMVSTTPRNSVNLRNFALQLHIFSLKPITDPGELLLVSHYQKHHDSGRGGRGREGQIDSIL